MSPRSALTRLVAAALTLLLGACTDIPTSGPVTEVTVSAEGRGVQIAPEPPQKGMSASRIVEGYLQGRFSRPSTGTASRTRKTSRSGI